MFHVKRSLIIKLRDGKKLEASFGNSDCALVFCLLSSSSPRKWLCIDLPLFNNTFCFSLGHPCLLPHPPVTAAFLYLLLSFFLPVSLNTVCSAAFFLLLCLAPQSCPILRPRGLWPVRLLRPWGLLQPRILEWVAMPSSKRSSPPRDQTQVSCIAGGFFTVWATREALSLWVCKKDSADPGMLIKILWFKRGGLIQFFFTKSNPGTGTGQKY